MKKLQSKQPEKLGINENKHRKNFFPQKTASLRKRRK